MFGMLEQVVVSQPRWPFRIGYEPSTNPAMRIKHQPNPAIAEVEHAHLCGTLRAKAVSVIESPFLDEDRATDDTFWANKALPVPGHNAIILANFLHEERKSETAHARQFLEPYFEDVFELPHDAVFEGQGDAFWWDEKTLLLGFGPRTNARGVVEVAKILRRLSCSFTVVPLELDSVLEEFNDYLGCRMKFYHRDLCLLPLRKHGTIWIYDMPFSEKTILSLARLARVRRVSRWQAHRMVLNSIEIPQCDSVIVPWADNATMDQFREDGYEPIIVPTDQFQLSGGANKCLVLELHGKPIPDE